MILDAAGGVAGTGISSDTLIHVGEALVMALVAFVGLKIKDVVSTISVRQLEIKEELVEKQNEMRTDMDEKHAENKQGLAVHEASDNAKFDAISRTLTRIDGKLDVAANRRA